MPTRWLSATIVVFWLGTNGWLFYHEVWPTLRPGQPPPMTIDLIQEAKKESYVNWSVTQNGRAVFKAKTSVKRLGPEVFELTADYVQRPRDAQATFTFAQVHRMHSSYRVTQEGNLLAVRVEIGATLSKKSVGDVVLTIAGTVESGRLAPHLRISSPALSKPFEKDLPAVAVPARGSVLLPLHPVDRIRGLRPGQAWTVPLLEPIGDSLNEWFGIGGGARFLHARIRDETAPLPERREDVPCLVIDYRGDDLKASTWVEEATGRVLRQDAEIGGDRWVMQRD